MATRFCLHCALFLLVFLPYVEASVKASGIPNTEESSKLRAQRRIREYDIPYWEHGGGAAEIAQLNIEYPGRHPHERHLQEEPSKYGMRPRDHDGNNDNRDYEEQEESDVLPSALRDPKDGQYDTEDWDDDFDRSILTYDNSYALLFDEEEAGNHTYKPLRIHFITSPLEERRGESAYLDQQIDELLTTAIPEAGRIWSSHLSVYPVQGSIEVSEDVCYGSFASALDPGPVSNADLVIIVGAYEELKVPGGDSVPVCGIRSLALGAACALDQWDRPIIGFVNLCLDKRPNTSPAQLDQLVSQAFQAANGFQQNRIHNNTDDDETRVDPTSILIHEVAHSLGFDSYLFKFFRDSTTGEPLTPRPFGTTFVQCSSGDPLQARFGFPSTKVVQVGLTQDGGTYMQIVTPKVAQVARNFFDCQSMMGARLENYGSSCLGSHWDERLFLTEMLSPALTWHANLLSPLTLALMEDTGWYKVNYENASMPSFGLGAGCDFVDAPCIVDDKVPDYAKDYFCDHPIRLQGGENTFFMKEESWKKVTCDPTQSYWAMCDLWDARTIPDFLNVRFPQGNESPYFSDDNLVVSFPQADYCPLAIEFLGIDCTKEDNEPFQQRRHAYLGEEAGPSSRCINAFSDISDEQYRRVDRPACMHLECDKENRKVILGTGEFQQVCDYDGQVLLVNGTKADYLECPRLATVCPHLFCPAGCSGRGICDYSAEPHPKCECFDPTDTSEACFNTDGRFDSTIMVSSEVSRVSKLAREQQMTDQLYGPTDGVDSEFQESLTIHLSAGPKVCLHASLAVVLILFSWFL